MMNCVAVEHVQHADGRAAEQAVHGAWFMLYCKSTVRPQIFPPLCVDALNSSPVWSSLFWLVEFPRTSFDSQAGLPIIWYPQLLTSCSPQPLLRHLLSPGVTWSCKLIDWFKESFTSHKEGKHMRAKPNICFFERIWVNGAPVPPWAWRLGSKAGW